MAGPGGRPTKIDQPVGTLPDGTTVTAADRVVDYLRAGNYLEAASAAAGVHRETVYGWLRIGADVHARLALADARGNRPPKLAAHEERCREFSDAVDRARAEWEVRANMTLEQLARGGLETRNTTVKYQTVLDAAGNPVVDADGNPRRIEVERSERVEVLAPNPQVIEWRLAHAFPDRYGNRLDVGVISPAAVPRDPEIRARELAAGIRGAIPTTATTK
jgi:transposase